MVPVNIFLDSVTFAIHRPISWSRYAWDWPCANATGTCRVAVPEGKPWQGWVATKSYDFAVETRREQGTAHAVDAASQTEHFDYTTQGRRHQVWYDTPETLWRKYQVARGAGCRGVGFWTADQVSYYADGGRRARAMWDALKAPPTAAPVRPSPAPPPPSGPPIYLPAACRSVADCYVYTTPDAAMAACRAAGHARLCTKAELTGHSKCAAGWLSDEEGYWMSAASPGCPGGAGFVEWRGYAGAYCCS